MTVLFVMLAIIVFLAIAHLAVELFHPKRRQVSPRRKSHSRRQCWWEAVDPIEPLPLKDHRSTFHSTMDVDIDVSDFGGTD
ncbi:hypothetical protein ACYFX5_24580 [Bremerella sp. T1]|uniref:hypothetical protein n=1 Tax=Bremerella sp. TYQ1 TaxID=3119568 RepID=UPI001CCD37E6|nr:hypothetical protein [Bremerella volcania]UBM36199.1 hypothetical protein LA756_26525 [Bremerella volcania]